MENHETGTVSPIAEPLSVCKLHYIRGIYKSKPLFAKKIIFVKTAGFSEKLHAKQHANPRNS